MDDNNIPHFHLRVIGINLANLLANLLAINLAKKLAMNVAKS